ncbi:MAG: hypothetical protein WCO51_01760 [bacterium]
MNQVMHFIRKQCPSLNIPTGWPVSEGAFELPSRGLGVFTAVACVCLASYFWWKGSKIVWGLRNIVCFAVLLLLLGNATKGISWGYEAPLVSIRQGETHYYDDAVQLPSSAIVLADYTKMQPAFGMHSRSHPPGPLLAMKFARMLLQSPILISALFGTLNLALACTLMYLLLRRLSMDSVNSRMLTMLYATMAAIQIYYLFSIDAIICTLGIALLLSIHHSSKSYRILTSAFFLWALMMMTFGALFYVPVILWLTWERYRRIGEAVATCALTILALIAMYWGFGFNYLQSFQIANHFENPGGFMLFSQPGSYLTTRLENIGDIIYFIGPAITYFLWMGFTMRDGSTTERYWMRLGKIGISVLIMVFLTGAYRTGETGRACLFILPFIILTIAPSVKRIVTPNNFRTLAIWVILHTLLLQILGFYYW